MCCNYKCITSAAEFVRAGSVRGGPGKRSELLVRHLVSACTAVFKLHLDIDKSVLSVLFFSGLVYVYAAGTQGNPSRER